MKYNPNKIFGSRASALATLVVLAMLACPSLCASSSSANHLRPRRLLAFEDAHPTSAAAVGRSSQVKSKTVGGTAPFAAATDESLDKVNDHLPYLLPSILGPDVPAAASHATDATAQDLTSASTGAVPPLAAPVDDPTSASSSSSITAGAAHPSFLSDESPTPPRSAATEAKMKRRLAQQTTVARLATGGAPTIFDANDEFDAGGFGGDVVLNEGVTYGSRNSAVGSLGAASVVGGDPFGGGFASGVGVGSGSGLATGSGLGSAIGQFSGGGGLLSNGAGLGGNGFDNSALLG